MYIRGVHRTCSPAQPAGPARTRIATTRTDQSNDWRRVAPHRTRSLQVGRRVSSPKTRATQPDHNINKIRRDWKVFRQRATWIYQIRQYFLFSDKDLLEIHQIRRDLARSRQDLLQIRQIQPNIGQIKTNSVKYWHWRRNIRTSNETRNRTNTNPKPDGPEPDDPTIKTGRFRFRFLPTRKIWVRSRLGTNLTRPDPWTPLMYITLKWAKVKSLSKCNPRVGSWMGHIGCRGRPSVWRWWKSRRDLWDVESNSSL